jgi:hypothetical protein
MRADLIRAMAAAALAAFVLLPPGGAAAQDEAGGALCGAAAGAFMGGMNAEGRPVGIIEGAIVGGTAGSMLGCETEKRPGYFWLDGDCYRRLRRGQVKVSRRYCY